MGGLVDVFIVFVWYVITWCCGLVWVACCWLSHVVACFVLGLGLGLFGCEDWVGWCCFGGLCYLVLLGVLFGGGLFM